MKIICYPAITLDGFIATKDGNSDWMTEEDGELFEAECKNAGCVIVGRTTFEQYEGELYPVPGAVTYVVTSKAADFESTSDVKYVLPDADAICKDIEASGFESALLSGGGETNGLFAKAGKIDEAIISIYPLMLGEGIRMLGSYAGQLKLDLISTKNLEQGVTQNRYKVL